VARTKMTRHQLKEQDEITTSLQKFTEFAYARQKEVMAGAAVLVVLVAAILGWGYYSRSRDARAQSELSQVIAIFDDSTRIPSDKDRYGKAVVEAQKVRDQYGSKPIGMIAQYYVALSWEGLGDTAKAQQNLQEVMQNGPADIKGVAQFALGGIHKKHGETQKAIDVYKQLYDAGTYSKAAVAYELATLYETNKQPDQAKDFYQKLVSEYPDSPFRSEADQALRRLGGSTPPPAQKPS
jgi:TolA-binding protein